MGNEENEMLSAGKALIRSFYFIVPWEWGRKKLNTVLTKA